MSRDHEAADAFDELPGARPRRESEVDEELRFHLELLTEQLCAEGYEQAEAENEARRRFGDVDGIAGECAAQRAGIVGVALRWLLASRLSAFAVSVLAVAGLVIADDLPVAMIGVLLPVSLAGTLCALLASLREDWGRLAIPAGRRLLGLLCLLAVICFAQAGGDWVHSLWSVQYTLSGLLLGSGVILVGVRPTTRARRSAGPSELRAVSVALCAAWALAALPCFLSGPHHDPPLATIETPSVTSTLASAALYGFGGAVPAEMEPAGRYKDGRVLGVPPREITVTMASTWFAALHTLLFVAPALIGRLLHDAKRRRAFLLLSPAFLAAAAFPFLGSETVRAGVWRNAPWFVNAYGPTLLLAVTATAALFIALRRETR